MSEFFQQLINGLALGSILALIALGYTMVYGILRFINFAHGDIFMLGGVRRILSRAESRHGSANAIHLDRSCRHGHLDADLRGDRHRD